MDHVATFQLQDDILIGRDDQQVFTIHVVLGSDLPIGSRIMKLPAVLPRFDQHQWRHIDGLLPDRLSRSIHLSV